MDLRKLKTLIDLVSESNISELEITEAEGKVRIVKARRPRPHRRLPRPLLRRPRPPRPRRRRGRPGGPAAPAAPPSPRAGPSSRRWSAPSTVPPAPAPSRFVELGDEVKEGQPVCIIEAMKIMNEIEADCSGKIVRILCENGQAVEFGQPLFIVE